MTLNGRQWMTPGATSWGGAISPAAMCNTSLHEVIHTINYGMGITSGKEEQLTNRLANGLCAVWKDNPEAFKWWANLIKEPVKRVKRAKRAKKRKRRT